MAIEINVNSHHIISRLNSLDERMKSIICRCRVVIRTTHNANYFINIIAINANSNINSGRDIGNFLIDYVNIIRSLFQNYRPIGPMAAGRSGKTVGGECNPFLSIWSSSKCFCDYIIRGTAAINS